MNIFGLIVSIAGAAELARQFMRVLEWIEGQR